MPVSGRLFRRASDDPDVRALLDDGWELCPDDPTLACLPYLWPPSMRLAVPDRTQLMSLHIDAAGGRRRLPAEAAVYEEFFYTEISAAEEAGIPPPPQGYLWLLTCPKGGSLQVLSTTIRGLEVSQKLPPYNCPERTLGLSRAIRGMFGERI